MDNRRSDRLGKEGGREGEGVLCSEIPRLPERRRGRRGRRGQWRGKERKEKERMIRGRGKGSSRPPEVRLPPRFLEKKRKRRNASKSVLVLSSFLPARDFKILTIQKKYGRSICNVRRWKS